MIGLLLASDVAAMLKVSRFTVERWGRSGELPSIRLGDGPRAPVRFRLDDIEEWLVDRSSTPQPKPRTSSKRAVQRFAEAVGES